jgi:hypothetical protein
LKQLKRLAHDCEHHSITREFESEVAYENHKKKMARENYYIPYTITMK